MIGFNQPVKIRKKFNIDELYVKDITNNLSDDIIDSHSIKIVKYKKIKQVPTLSNAIAPRKKDTVIFNRVYERQEIQKWMGWMCE
jgi:hypothetical protein